MQSEKLLTLFFVVMAGLLMYLFISMYITNTTQGGSGGSSSATNSASGGSQGSGTANSASSGTSQGNTAPGNGGTSAQSSPQGETSGNQQLQPTGAAAQYNIAPVQPQVNIVTPYIAPAASGGTALGTPGVTNGQRQSQNPSVNLTNPLPSISTPGIP